MKQSVRTVVFADLTGSTGLFETAGNVVATRIVTRCTHTLGRHLVLAGGQLFGFLGMLLALPVAAVANVLLHYAVERYRASRIYQGEQPVPVVILPEGAVDTVPQPQDPPPA